MEFRNQILNHVFASVPSGHSAEKYGFRFIEAVYLNLGRGTVHFVFRRRPILGQAKVYVSSRELGRGGLPVDNYEITADGHVYRVGQFQIELVTEASDEPIESRRRDFVNKGLRLSLTEDDAMWSAVTDAHLVGHQRDGVLGNNEDGRDGNPARVGNYNDAQIRQMTEILARAGFDKDQRRWIIASGAAGSSSTGGGMDPGVLHNNPYAAQYEAHRAEASRRVSEARGTELAVDMVEVERRSDGWSQARIVLASDTQREIEPPFAYIVQGRTLETSITVPGHLRGTGLPRLAYLYALRQYPGVHYINQVGRQMNAGAFYVELAEGGMKPGDDRHERYMVDTEYRGEVNSTVLGMTASFSGHASEEARQFRQRILDALTHAMPSGYIFATLGFNQVVAVLIDPGSGLLTYKLARSDQVIAREPVVMCRSSFMGGARQLRRINSDGSSVPVDPMHAAHAFAMPAVDTDLFRAPFVASVLKRELTTYERLALLMATQVSRQAMGPTDTVNQRPLTTWQESEIRAVLAQGGFGAGDIDQIIAVGAVTDIGHLNPVLTEGQAIDREVKYLGQLRAVEQAVAQKFGFDDAVVDFRPSLKIVGGETASTHTLAVDSGDLSRSVPGSYVVFLENDELQVVDDVSEEWRGLGIRSLLVTELVRQRPNINYFIDYYDDSTARRVAAKLAYGGEAGLRRHMHDHAVDLQTALKHAGIEVASQMRQTKSEKEVKTMRRRILSAFRNSPEGKRLSALGFSRVVAVSYDAGLQKIIYKVARSDDAAGVAPQVFVRYGKGRRYTRVELTEEGHKFQVGYLQIEQAMYAAAGRPVTDEWRIDLVEEELQTTFSDTERGAIIAAHREARGEPGRKEGTIARVGNYTEDQLQRKRNILRAAGFSETEIDTIIDIGAVGDSGSAAEHLEEGEAGSMTPLPGAATTGAEVERVIRRIVEAMLERRMVATVPAGLSLKEVVFDIRRHLLVGPTELGTRLEEYLLAVDLLGWDQIGDFYVSFVTLMHFTGVSADQAFSKTLDILEIDPVMQPAILPALVFALEQLEIQPRAGILGRIGYTSLDSVPADKRLAIVLALLVGANQNLPNELIAKALQFRGALSEHEITALVGGYYPQSLSTAPNAEVARANLQRSGLTVLNPSVGKRALNDLGREISRVLAPLIAQLEADGSVIAALTNEPNHQFLETNVTPSSEFGLATLGEFGTSATLANGLNAFEDMLLAGNIDPDLVASVSRGLRRVTVDATSKLDEILPDDLRDSQAGDVSLIFERADGGLLGFREGHFDTNERYFILIPLYVRGSSVEKTAAILSPFGNRILGYIPLHLYTVLTGLAFAEEFAETPEQLVNHPATNHRSPFTLLPDHNIVRVLLAVSVYPPQ